ncbi:tudor domain-containing 3 isoform B [Micractinium conductrix]|uniref:Tudor domain-containing 3 isoform B n=1 Tax=Micractinium conductrix TaxID=554055 RepID=A0A2P6VRG1_9CHLO|nr:tudor domain-containing 3 isoform B [Micractinium conductrix]|eukprot:PSC76684.1 tudor domain-containing 3 isoform B [Micractinium conductrix]
MATLQALREAGWSLNEQAEHGPRALPQALLDADLRQVGAPQLPDDIGRVDSKKVAGPLVLQVSAVAAAQPRQRRRKSCVGVEFSPLPTPTEKLCPGTKMCLRSVTVRVGVLLLEPRCLEVLGGRVAELAEAWQTQQQFGGAEKERADAADTERPPAFHPWDPKIAKYGSRRGGVAQATAAAAAQAGTAAAQAGAGAAAAAVPAGPAAGAAAAGALRPGAAVRLDDDEDDAGTMTLEEWEARRHDGGGGASAGGGAAQQQQAMTDEELARQLQRQLDLEAAQEVMGQEPLNLAATLQGIFTYSRDDEDGGYGSGGRGRGARAASAAARGVGAAGGGTDAADARLASPTCARCLGHVASTQGIAFQ